NTTFTMVDTLLFPSGSGCQILVELQADENDCSCLSDTVVIIPELELNYPDTFVCANVPIVLGDSIPTGYSQLWLTLDPTESGALSSSSGAMPTALWNPNPPNETDTIDIQIMTDRIGCFAFDTMQLLVHPDVLVDAGEDTTICHYDAINLDGAMLNYADSMYWTQLSGPSVLVFSDASDTLSLVSGFVAGTYELVLTGVSDFCASHTDTMTITTFDVDLSELSINHVSCFGYADGEIQLEANNGVAPYLFSLDGGAYTSNTVYSPLDTGSYTFVVQDIIGCYDTLISSITEPATLTVTLTGIDISCSTFLDGYITSNSAGGTMPYSYSWSNSAVTPDIFGLDSGQYILNITDTNGCTASDSVILSSPPPVIVNAGSDDSLCHYDGINLSGTIVSLVDSIAWEQISGPSALTFTDINDVNTAVSGFVGGLYELVLYGYNDNCPGHSDTVIITSFEPQINELSASNVSCFNFADGEVNVAGSNGLIPYLYSVNGGAYTPMTNYPSLDTGMYEFVMQDNFGCLDTLVSIITQPDSIAIVFAQTDVSCFGFTDGAIDATISGGMPTYNFSWSNGQTTQNSTALGAGWHMLTVLDDNGCTAVDSIEILAPPPLNLTATIDSVICNGNLDGNIDVLVTGGTVNYSYAWTGGIVTEDLIGYPAGTYDLVVTDDNGCVISASYEIFEPD
ncbi:MAG TPA: hypothetical protein EYN30_07095, partial [Candidatus Poseidoniales archaeon]|nr:hypothetical protein [Candidatus Poseidoniales archaeon]